jgi:hypothetical protein
MRTRRIGSRPIRLVEAVRERLLRLKEKPIATIVAAAGVECPLCELARL